MAPAGGALGDVAANMTDPDGNLVEQFQTHGFDSRTFEIYLTAFFAEAGHEIDLSHDRPDFLISRDGITAAVEAVTANPKPGPEYQPYEPTPLRARTGSAWRLFEPVAPPVLAVSRALERLSLLLDRAGA